MIGHSMVSGLSEPNNPSTIERINLVQKCEVISVSINVDCICVFC